MKVILGQLAWWRVRLILCIICLVGLIACKNQGGPERKSEDVRKMPDLVETLDQSVVSIECINEDSKKTKTGTGFFVSHDGLVVTCAHLIKGAKTIRVKTLTGAEYKFLGVKKIDIDKDLALLSVDAEGIVPLSPMSAPSISVGSQITVFGNPLRFKGTFTEGVVSAIREDQSKGGRVLQISAPISPGSSGSPVVNLKGKLVGMVTSGATAGEGLGFAISAEFVWELVEGANGDNVNIEKDVDVYRDSLSKSRKRYLASKPLDDDPDWKHGELLWLSPAQRIVVLRRLIARHPDDAILRIKTAEALKGDDQKEEAFDVITKLLDEDPGNRLALHTLNSIYHDHVRKTMYYKASIKADPLNFRARRYISAGARSGHEFQSAMTSAKSVVEIAPFSLRSMEDYIDTRLSYQLFDRAAGGRDVYSLLVTSSINKANKLRVIINSAAQVVATPNKMSLEKFLVVAKKTPAESLPYAYELFQIRRKDLREFLDGGEGETLKEFVRDAMTQYPVVAEAYLLDYSAVGASKFLLREELYWVTTEAMAFFPDELPRPGGAFDQLGYILLIEDLSSEDTPRQTREKVICLKNLYDEKERTVKEGIKLQDEIDTSYGSRWGDQIIFQFWLAIHKERFSEMLKSEKTSEEEKVLFRKAINVLKDTPSKKAATARVQSAVKRSADEGQNYWTYCTRKHGDLLRSTFERAAR